MFPDDESIFVVVNVPFDAILKDRRGNIVNLCVARDSQIIFEFGLSMDGHGLASSLIIDHGGLREIELNVSRSSLRKSTG